MQSPSSTPPVSLAWSTILLVSIAIAAAAAIGVSGCTDTDPSDNVQDTSTGSDMASPPDVTYHRDVRPIVDQSCNGCHDGQGIAPDAFNFTDPQTVVDLAPVVVQQVTSKAMPPWAANRGCGEFEGDLSLTEEEIQTFVDWSEAGAPLGDESEYVAREPRTTSVYSDRLADDEMISVTPDASYLPDASIEDDFRCFVVDPGFTSTRHLTGFDVNVDNASVLHHMIVFMVDGSEETATELEALENEDAQPGFSCFAGVWAPGIGQTGFPPGTGIEVEAGTKFVLQMHYNTYENNGEPDQSSANLWFLPEGESPTVLADMLFVGNLPFEVPAGVDGAGMSSTCETVYDTTEDTIPGPANGVSADEASADPSLVGSEGCVVQEFYYDNPLPLDLYMIGPHMHLKGTHMTAELMETRIENGVSVPQEASSECLIQTDRYDFDWQRGYWFKEPLEVPQRGLVRLTCRYDNRFEDDPIALGEGSGDEMCLAVLFVASP